MASTSRTNRMRRADTAVASAARKVIVYVATSADGFIARPDGDVGWLDRPMPKGEYGMPEFYRSVDTILYGRKTYDFGVSYGQPFDAKKRNIVFSRSRPENPAPHTEFTSEAPGDVVATLRTDGGSNIWVMGGAEIIGALIDAGQVDELIVHVIPVLIGEGIPLASPARRESQLTLVSTEAHPDGVVRLHYAFH